MKFGRLIILILIFVGIYFYKDLIIEKIKPYTANIPLTKEAQKLIGLDVQNELKGSGQLTKNDKEVLLPGPLKQIFSQDSQNSNELFYKKIIESTNTERVKNNLKPLTENTLLNNSATFKSNDMNSGQYFEHVSPEGVSISDLANQFKYEYITIGENLAMGNFQTEDEIVIAWMNSPGHRANILNPKYTQIGVGIVSGTWQGKHVWYAVQHFGKPLSACPSIDRNLKSIIDKNQLEISSIKKSLDNQKIKLDQAGSNDQNYPDLVKAYNELVNDYNSLINETKLKINTYNLQVKAFNTCSQ